MMTDEFLLTLVKTICWRIKYAKTYEFSCRNESADSNMTDISNEPIIGNWKLTFPIFGLMSKTHA